MTRIPFFLTTLLAALAATAPLAVAHSGPFDGRNFKGRIAWSCDGNHNDEDDWAASPAALAIFAVFGVKDRLVHFDYNNILPQTNPAWEQEHELSIRGAITRYGYNRRIFHDCCRNRDAAVASIAKAINESSADNPLYLVLAGPMEVPLLGIQKSDPAKRRFVYCISHSRWNDGFARGYTFSYNKRAVIPTGVHWIQIADQNPGLSTGPFGRPHTDKEWAPWLWMRDSPVEPVRFLWERLRATRRADCSDAGMAYFLMTGDESADIPKLRRLLEQGERPAPIDPRPYVRLEAENFLELDNYQIEDTDRTASHQLNVKFAGGPPRGRIRGPFDQPYTSAAASYDVEVRYRVEPGASCSYAFLLNGARQGAPWRSQPGEGWQSHPVASVVVKAGDTIGVETECTGGGGRLDYIHLRRRS